MSSVRPLSAALERPGAGQIPAWFIPMVGLLIGAAFLAIQLVNLRSAAARAAMTPPAASTASQEAP